MTRLVLAAYMAVRALPHGPADRDRSERGDVPGWVLITLMTAGIGMAIWIIAEPKLSSLLGGALDISGDPNG
jgi:hypothetical protein